MTCTVRLICVQVLRNISGIYNTFNSRYVLRDKYNDYYRVTLLYIILLYYYILLLYYTVRPCYRSIVVSTGSDKTANVGQYSSCPTRINGHNDLKKKPLISNI